MNASMSFLKVTCRQIFSLAKKSLTTKVLFRNALKNIKQSRVMVPNANKKKVIPTIISERSIRSTRIIYITYNSHNFQ